MAIAIMQDFPGMTQEMYDRINDQVSAQLNLDGNAPQGCLFHTASRPRWGRRVLDVWESQDAFNKFLATLGPIAQSAGAPQPQVTIWPLHNILTPKGYAIGG